MNDQTIMVVFGFLATIIVVITPIIKLNATIAKLTTLLENLEKTTEANHEQLLERVKTHGKEIDDINNRVTAVETFLEIKGKD